MGMIYGGTIPVNLQPSPKFLSVSTVVFCVSTDTRSLVKDVISTNGVFFLLA